MKKYFKFIFIIILTISLVNINSYKSHSRNLYNLLLNNYSFEGEVDETQMPYKIEIEFTPYKSNVCIFNTFEDTESIQSIVNLLQSYNCELTDSQYDDEIPANLIRLYLYFSEINIDGKITTQPYYTHKTLYITSNENICFTRKSKNNKWIIISNYEHLEELKKYLNSSYFEAPFNGTMYYDSSVPLYTDENILNFHQKNNIDLEENIVEKDNKLSHEVNQAENKINTIDIPIMQEKQSQNELTIDSEANQDTNLINNDNNEYSININDNNFKNNILNYSMIGLIFLLVILLIIIIKKHNKKI